MNQARKKRKVKKKLPSQRVDEKNGRDCSLAAKITNKKQAMHKHTRTQRKARPTETKENPMH